MLIAIAEKRCSLRAAETPNGITGLIQEDLVGVIGSRGVVSEVMNGKRSISNTQAKALGDFFSVEPSLFIVL
jgi:HTH-type transcriptional regulator/antitoxin HigA